MTERRCKGVKADGAKCASTIGLSDDSLCILHDPARAEQAREIQSAGGVAHAEKYARFDLSELPELKTHADARIWQETVARAVLSGKLDRRDAGVVGRIIEAWTKNREGELTIDELEKLQETQKKLRAESRGKPRVVA